MLASWLVDCLPAPVGFSIVGPESTQSAQLFRLLAALYRRALVLTEANLSALISLPTELRPSLFLEFCEPGRKLQKLLRSSSHWESYVPRNGKLVNICGAKVVRTENSLPADMFGDRFLEIQTEPSHPELPALGQHALKQVALEFQPKLLMFRLKHFNCDGEVRSTGSDFAPSIQSIASSLLRCVPEESALQAQVIALLKTRSDQVLEEQPEDLRAIVAEAMLTLCHEQGRQSAHVSDVAKIANDLLKARGELLVMSDKSVGVKLEELGLRTRRLDAAGRGLHLLKSVRQRVHRWAQRYRIFETKRNQGICPHCKENYGLA